MRAVITGGTGLVGRALLSSIPEAIVLTRDPVAAAKKLGVVSHGWDPLSGPPPAEAFDGCDVVFNLAGEPVSEGRWTADKKRRIRDSRVLGTRNLVAGLSQLETKPKVLVSASAIGFYGDGADAQLDERSAAGADFLAGVCAAWEQEALVAQQLGIRVVAVRIGIVLTKDGGALSRMLPPFKLGAGGRLANGCQWMPWVHIDDLVGVLLHAAQYEISGPVNAVSPNPVTNKEFTVALGRALRRPTVFPVPQMALRAVFGEMSDMLVASQRVLPRVAQRSGYRFEHPELKPALDEILATASSRNAA